MQLDWDNLRVFIELHRSGTLAGAARALNMDPTTVGRRVERLQEALGGTLFVHTPEGFGLTDLGQHILASTEQVERHAIAVQRQARGEDTRLEGNVRLSCTPGFASRVVLPGLPPFVEEHPRIEVEVLTGYQLADISRRETDLALRVSAEGAGVPLSGGDADEIVARKVGRVSFGLYASHDYVKRRGPLTTPLSLEGHDIVAPTAIGGGSASATWLQAHAAGAHARVRCDDAEAVAAAASAGFGIALLPAFMASGTNLCRLADDYSPMRRDVWLLVHRDLQRVARILALSRFIGDLFDKLGPTMGRVAPGAPTVAAKPHATTSGA